MLHYIYISIIVIALLAIAFLRRKTKKEMRAETVKKSCLKAKEYAEDIFGDVKHKGTHILLGSTRLGHLSGLITDASWYAFQIVNVKRDIVFEGIANSLDVLASELTTVAEDGYIPAGEYQACVKRAIGELELTITKLDAMIASK